MTDVLLEASETPAVPVHAVTEAALEAWIETRPDFTKRFVSSADFKATSGQILQIPDEDGAPAAVLFGLGKTALAMAFRTLAAKLPGGVYRIGSVSDDLPPGEIALAFALGSYRFDRYKAPTAEQARLLVEDADLVEVRQVAHACALARDMINTPANDMGPLQIETIAREIADQFAAQITVTVGEGLLEANYPAVHAVGRAAVPERAPRMIEISWGEAAHPLIAIVGKGVVFDTGGLDIKPSSGMRLMKKDMGGAAHALALGRMVMSAGLPVRLAILVPAVENAISGDAMRPGDVLASRKGLSIEVGNTDAEGRLILADALTRAGELEPALTAA